MNEKQSMAKGKLQKYFRKPGELLFMTTYIEMWGDLRPLDHLQY